MMYWIIGSLISSSVLGWVAISTLRRGTLFSISSAIKLLLGGALLALPCRLLVTYLLDSFGWSMRIGPTVSPTTAWLSATFVTVPVEHLALVVVLWPMYRNHRLLRAETALTAAGFAAVGFGAVGALLGVTTRPSVFALLLGMGSLISRIFGASIWASCLASTRIKYRPWLPLAWFSAILVDGFVRHLLEARGVGFVIVATPPLVAMLTVGFWWSRLTRNVQEGTATTTHHRLGFHVDAAGLESVRAAFQHANRPALVHWILGGALVSFGANLVGLAIGALLAHRLHIDLSRVDESNANAMAPLLLLGGCMLFSFALSGYLTAKASAADSLFEPAMAAIISIVALSLLLSRSAPVTIVLGLALSPLAFAVACAGAWLGLSKH